MKTRPHTTQPLRIGILSCANIAKQFARDVAASPAVKIVAVASRQLETAQAFAAAQGIGRAHGSYEALLNDAEVDAIYLPLPNSLHAEWAIKAAQSGKHILCEKPLALNRREAQAMFDAARAHGVMLLEAYPYYFQPQTGDMLALLHGGAIGNVRSMQACFGFTLPNPQGNIRLNPELGGGALLDAANYRHAVIAGTAGTIETEYLNHTSTQAGGHPWGYLPSELRVRRGTANTLPFEVIHSPTGSGFRFAAQAFAQKVAEQDFAAMDRAAQASLDIAATLEALALSARQGRAVALAELQ